MTDGDRPADGAPDAADEFRAGPLRISLLVEGGDWPARGELEALLGAAASQVLAETGASAPDGCELSLVFTDDRRVAELNQAWRGKQGPTNVLSFPLRDLSPGEPLPPALGDIVFAFETVAREAVDQDKPVVSHIGHLFVHGLLHLMGHDHDDDREANVMEGLERRVLARLAIPDPYA